MSRDGSVMARAMATATAVTGSQMRNDLHGDWIVASHTAVVDRVECPAGTGECARDGLERADEVLIVHPARHFWAFQAIETATFVSLAIAPLVRSIYWVRHRIT